MSKPIPPQTRNYGAFTVKGNGYLNRIITDIAVSCAFDAQSPPHPLPPTFPAKALWDTGATKSAISTRVVKTLGLTPCGTGQIRHAGGLSSTLRYMVHFLLPQQATIFGAHVGELNLEHEAFDVIVGMDVICIGDFTISNVNRQTWVSFRIPSMQAVDYVNEGKVRLYGNTPRNAPCPCGSGEKFKRCHGSGKF